MKEKTKERLCKFFVILMLIGVAFIPIRWMVHHPYVEPSFVPTQQDKDLVKIWVEIFNVSQTNWTLVLTPRGQD